MKNTSSAMRSINTSLSMVMDFPSRAETIAVCCALLFEAFLIFMGNLFIIALFALEKKLRKRSLFLVINMAFADVMLGAVSLPLYAYLRVGFPQLWIVTEDVGVVLHYFYLHFDLIFLQASLISAVFISCERFFAVYWPLKHLTTSTRAYTIVIVIIWTLAATATAVYLLTGNLISSKAGYYVSTILFSIFIFILCGCNIGIWRKFHQRDGAFPQHNRVSQNKRLTKTLLFVSAAAVLCWLPYVIVDCLTEVLEVPVPREVYFAVIMLNYSNSLFNPIIYALTVPDYRQSLVTCCPRRQAVDGTNIERENNWTDVRLRHMLRGSTSPAAADPSHPHLAFENESFETKL